MLVMLFLISRVIKQVTKIQERYSEITLQESAYWALQKTIRNLNKHREVSSGAEIPSLKKLISLEDVSFSYGESRVLKNVHIRFPVGQITAVVGTSGSGKTTILDLVVGLIRPQEGEVCIDGVPLQRIDLKRWRQMIGYVPQETILLHDTIFNNVTLGEKHLNKEDALTALQAAGALEFINELPKGIDHIVGERGGKLSGGQQQRISIARALVHRPALIVFDEATSALDPASEEAICETMRRLRESSYHHCHFASDRLAKMRRPCLCHSQRCGRANPSDRRQPVDFHSEQWYLGSCSTARIPTVNGPTLRVDLARG